MSRIEWPVRINGHVELVTVRARNNATREEMNDAAISRANELGYPGAEAYYQTEEDEIPEYDPGVKDAHNG